MVPRIVAAPPLTNNASIILYTHEAHEVAPAASRKQEKKKDSNATETCILPGNQIASQAVSSFSTRSRHRRKLDNYSELLMVPPRFSRYILLLSSTTS